MIKNGPARCFHGYKAFESGTWEFMIHLLVEGKPVCKFKTEYKFITMEVPIDKIADWKKCPECFKLGKKEINSNPQIKIIAI